MKINCTLCEAFVEGPDDIAKQMIVGHVHRMHREHYIAACCVDGKHGSLCDRNHE